MPMIERDRGRHEGLEHDAREDLPAAGAERAQHRDLADALGDRDREHVEDQEGADEHGDAAEREQAGPRKPLMRSEIPFESAFAFSLPVCTL